MEQASEHITVRQVCEALSRKAIAEACGVKINAVGAAVAAGKFPAKWFVVLTKLCADNGISCPKVLFSFVKADQT